MCGWWRTVQATALAISGQVPAVPKGTPPNSILLVAQGKTSASTPSMGYLVSHRPLLRAPLRVGSGNSFFPLLNTGAAQNVRV